MNRATARKLAWIVVSIVSLAAVVWWATRQQAPEMPTSAAAVGWLVASLGAYGLAIFLRGWRWDRILSLSGIPHDRADAFWLIPVAYAGNTVLPLRGGEILRISLMSKRANASVREVIGTVIAERILDVTTLAVLFAVLTWTGVDGAPTGKIAAYIAAGLVIFAAALLFAYLLLRRRGRFDAFAARIRPYAHGSRLFTNAEGLTLAGVSGVIWLLEGATVMLVGRSLGIHLGTAPRAAHQRDRNPRERDTGGPGLRRHVRRWHPARTACCRSERRRRYRLPSPRPVHRLRAGDDRRARRPCRPLRRAPPEPQRYPSRR